MTNELKPCPFCGPDTPGAREYSPRMAIVDEGVNEPDGLYAVYCPLCGTVGDDYSSMEAAIIEWNARPTEDALRAENERLREALRPIANPDWQEDEPSELSRAELPADWRRYIDEMERFAARHQLAARAALKEGDR